MTSCEFVNPLLEPDWNDRLAQFPDADFFHSREWAQLLAECYEYPLYYARLRDSNGCLAIVPIAEVRSTWTGCRGVSLPFSDLCVPLGAANAPWAEIAEALKSFGAKRGWSFLELRGPAPGFQDAVRHSEFLVHDLNLSGSEKDQFAKLRDSHRRNIRKAQRSSVEIHSLRSADAMDQYYRLHCLTRRRHGLPPQPIRFFRLLHRLIDESGRGFVQLARYGDQWIAGAVFLKFGLRATYKFGASDLRFQHLRPNNLLMWDAICRLRQAGAVTLSFGRTDLEDHGLLQFKRGWGVEERQVAYHRLSVTELAASAPSTGRSPMVARVARQLPIGVLRLLGSLAYRHVA